MIWTYKNSKIYYSVIKIQWNKITKEKKQERTHWEFLLKRIFYCLGRRQVSHSVPRTQATVGVFEVKNEQKFCILYGVVNVLGLVLHQWNYQYTLEPGQGLYKLWNKKMKTLKGTCSSVHDLEGNKVGS